ncbi:MAG: hypothetical protein QOE70_271 [Chthoniobacter sp.]|jgi:MFS family permease|nr:hypothetical protein [Chthoniobacter sp.]
MEAILEHPRTTTTQPVAQVRSSDPPTAARLAVSALFFMNGALFASWVSRIPAVQAERGMSHGTLGLALLAIALGALVAMPLAGWSSSRFGSRRITQIAAALYGVALPLLACVANPALFALVLFCFGAAHGALDVAMNAQAVAVEQRYRRPIMSSFHALFSVGGLVGAALGGLVAAAGVAPATHFFGAALLLAASTAIFAFPRLLEAGEAQARELLAGLEDRPKFAWPPRALLALGAVAFCVMMGEGAMADWSAVFLRQAAGATDAVAAAGYAAFSIAMALGRLSGDRLSTRFGPVMLVRAGGAIAAAGLGSALIFAQPALALLGFAAVGAGFATVVPQVFSAAGSTPGMASGPALATTTTIGYFGFLIGPPAIGFAAELIGLRGALGIVVAMTLLMIALAPTVRPAAGHRR